MTSPTTAAGSPVHTVRLHRGIYMQQAIREAAQAFADFASFAIAREGEHYVVTVRDIDPNVDGDLVAEFSNFALMYTATRKRKKVA